MNTMSCEREIEAIDNEIMELMEKRKALLRRKDRSGPQDILLYRPVRQTRAQAIPENNDCYFPDI